MAIEESSFDLWQLQEIHSLFFEVFRSAMGSTGLHIQLVVGAFSLGERRPDREAAHSPVSNSVVKNEWNSYFPQCASLVGKLRNKICLSSSSGCV